MNDELKRIRDDGAGIYECDVQHPERRFDENGYKYRDFQAGFDFALTQLQHVPEVMAMREALKLIMDTPPHTLIEKRMNKCAFDAFVAFDELCRRLR